MVAKFQFIVLLLQRRFILMSVVILGLTKQNCSNKVMSNI